MRHFILCFNDQCVDQRSGADEQVCFPVHSSMIWVEVTELDEESRPVMYEWSAVRDEINWTFTKFEGSPQLVSQVSVDKELVLVTEEQLLEE